MRHLKELGEGNGGKREIRGNSFKYDSSKKTTPRVKKGKGIQKRKKADATRLQ